MTPPRLLPGTPVVALDADQAMVGDLLVRGLSRPLAGALAQLDGRRSTAWVARHTGVPLDALDRAVALVGAHGMLAEAAPAGLVVVVGKGQLARSVRRALQEEGLDVAVEPPADWRGVACVVLAPDAAGVDRYLTDDLTRRDVPHLVVHPEPGGAVVGPFVLPGQSACQRCADEYRAGRERGWARRGMLLAQSPCVAGPTAAAWAVALATTHVVALLRGEVPESAGTSWHLTGGRLSSRSWPVHPRCGCADLALVA